MKLSSLVSSLPGLLASLACASVFAQAASAPAAPAAPAEAARPAGPDLAKGQATAAVCGSCHAFDGSRGSPANPIIQGQHPDYIVKQLREFKAGQRINPIMQAIAAQLSDEDMRNVAAFYATKQPKPGFARNKELALAGQRAYKGGIVDRQIPSCAGCHAPNGAGIPSQYPRIAGQHADYTEAQLVAFRSGARRNNPVMNAVASKLNDAEIKALSDYLAGLR
jgi:cytochrome c553